MRADSAGAKTWLLGAVALWALCTWALALFGLGGRVDRLAEDPSLLKPLPQAGKPPPGRLGPLPRYSEIGQRPLFSSDRKPQPFFINPGGEEEGQTGFDYVLTSVLIAPDFRMAILQPASGEGEPVRLEPGEAPESAPGWTLASVDARSAVFNGPEGERKLELRVFDGIGGQPPTPMSTPRRPDQPAMMVQPPSPEDMGIRPPQAGPAGGKPPAATEDADGGMPQPAPPAGEETSPRPSSEQIDAIRKRIEERRRKLREELQQQPPPGQTP